MITALLAKTLITPLESVDNAVLLMEDGRISALGARDAVEIPKNARVVDLGDSILTPGLIDIHVHGGGGHDVMEATDESLGAIERQMARTGVTSYCPTTVTAPLEATLQSLQRLGDAAKRSHKQADGALRAQPLGIHLEGPFLSHAQRGVHPPELLQTPSLKVFEQLCEAAQGHVKVLTIAPELESATEVIRAASDRGIRASLGHSNADLQQAKAGIEAGATHATHTFNAMRKLDHREPGLLGEVLTDGRLTADIIVDGIHVAPEVVDLFFRAKGIERAVLITDGISATGMPDGKYMLGPFEVTVANGRCEYQGRLAGSVLTLDRAVRNMMLFARTSFEQSIRMATLNPARVLGVENRKGVLQPGADADIVVFTPRGEVRQTIVGGRMA